MCHRIYRDLDRSFSEWLQKNKEGDCLNSCSPFFLYFSMKTMRHKYEKTKDPYLWLEKNSKKTEQWLTIQKKELSGYFSNSENKHNLQKRFKKLFYADSMTIPDYKNGYLFFCYRKSNEEERSFYMQNGLNARPKLLLNMNSLPKKDRAIMNGWHASRDARYVAFEFSKAGNDRNELRIFDTQKKEFLKERISSAHYPYFQTWDKKSGGFWYVRCRSNLKKTEKKYYKRLYFHKLGESEVKDKMFFGENLEKEDWPILNLSHGGEYITIAVHKNDRTTKVFFHDTQIQEKRFLEITRDIKAESYPYIGNNYIYLDTNYKAPNRKILCRKILPTGLGEWKTFVHETPNKLESFVVVSNYLILEYLINASSQLYVIDLTTKKKRKIELPDIGTINAFSTDFKTQTVFIDFSSFSIPPRIYKINLKSSSIKPVWKASAQLKARDIVITQEWYASKDAVRIPMFIMRKKITKRNGNNPSLIYAYGGFGVSQCPEFFSSIVPFLEDGGIFVLVNIRGGGEFGKKWHESVILKKRQKSFNDFSFALNYLIKRKYTNSNKMAIWGESNGGLLMSVTMIQHPELYKAAVIDVPITDMLRFHLFHGGRFWISEYGDPDDKETQKYLLKYSPYHNVKTMNYPSALFTTSDQDDRVHPAHSFKMVARLKNNPAQKNPILLRVEKNSGHNGANLITPLIKKFTDMFAFIYKELGVKL